MSDEETIITSQTGTLIGPMTTAWEVPSSCSMNLLCSTCAMFFRAGESCARSEPAVQEDTRCWPPAATGVQIASPDYPFFGWGYYSPGLVCPTGYARACTAVFGQRPQWPIQFTLEEGETAVGCCPEGYACTNRYGNTCVSVVSDSATVTAGTCDDNMSDTTDISLHTIGPFAATTMTDGSVWTRTPTMFAPMFQMNYRSSDMTIPVETGTTISAPEPTSTNNGGTEGNSDANSDGNEDSGSSDDGGLSTGAMAGIGVGAALGAILLIALAWFLFRRRRRQHAPVTQSELAAHPAQSASRGDAPTYYATEPKPSPLSHELNGSSTASELMDTGRPAAPVEIGTYR